MRYDDSRVRAATVGALVGQITTNQHQASDREGVELYKLLQINGYVITNKPITVAYSTIIHRLHAPTESTKSLSITGVIPTGSLFLTEDSPLNSQCPEFVERFTKYHSMMSDLTENVRRVEDFLGLALKQVGCVMGLAHVVPVSMHNCFSDQTMELYNTQAREDPSRYAVLEDKAAKFQREHQQDYTLFKRLAFISVLGSNV